MQDNTMDWTIEKATYSDADTIAGFQVAMALESEGTVLDYYTVYKGVFAGIGDPSKGIYYLARTGDRQTAGSLFLTKEWSDWNCCWYWWIQSVYVFPEFRCQGAFTAMYRKIKEYAMKEGAASLRLYVDRENRDAQECYRNCGMKGCHYLMYEETLPGK